MEFDLNQDQQEIKGVARDLLAARSPFAKVRHASETATYQDELWSELLALGWPGIAVTEARGGQGLGAVELAVLLEELGYACAATPMLSTATAASVIQADGSSQQQARWLPGLTSGEITAGIGSGQLVADAVDAGVIVLIEGDDAVLVDRAVADVTPMHTIDGTRRFGSLRATGEPLGTGAAGRIRAAVAAEVVGLCQRALDMTLEYVNERKQFGVAVGSFQAVSHRCAQMFLATESARSTAYYAAWAADAAPERLLEAAALAAAAAADSGREVTASAIQAHGGIGFTWEADVHWLYKRAQLDALLIGGASRHRAALARIVGEQVRAAGAS
jgi:alkylation response protein AidB-like acyl-CoA dehydrogenase